MRQTAAFPCIWLQRYMFILTVLLAAWDYEDYAIRDLFFKTCKTRLSPHWLWGMLVDFTSAHIFFFFLRWPAGIKVLILDGVSALCYPSRASQPHPFASHRISPGLLQAIVADWWWPLRPIGEVSAGLVSEACSGGPRPVRGSREQPACLAW